MKRLAHILFDGLAHGLALLCLAVLALWIAWMAGHQPLWRETDPLLTTGSEGWRWSATRSGVRVMRYVPYAQEERGEMAPGPVDANWIAAHSSHDFEHTLGGFTWQKKTYIQIVRDRSLLYPFVRDEHCPVAHGTEFIGAAPYWAIIVACGAIPFWRLRGLPRLARRAARFSGGRCISCGCDLDAGAARCPECGATRPAKPRRKDVVRFAARSLVPVVLYCSMLAFAGLMVLWLVSFDTGAEATRGSDRFDGELHTTHHLNVDMRNGELLIGGEGYIYIDTQTPPQELIDNWLIHNYSSQALFDLSAFQPLPNSRFGVSYLIQGQGSEQTAREENRKRAATPKGRIITYSGPGGVDPGGIYFASNAGPSASRTYKVLISRPILLGVLSAPFFLLSVFVIRRKLKPHRFSPGKCRRCGYDLRATPHRCPECGNSHLQTV